MLNIISQELCSDCALWLWYSGQAKARSRWTFCCPVRRLGWPYRAAAANTRRIAAEKAEAKCQRVFKVPSKSCFQEPKPSRVSKAQKWLQPDSSKRLKMDPVIQHVIQFPLRAVRGVALSTSGNAWVVPRDHRSGHGSDFVNLWANTCTFPYIFDRVFPMFFPCIPMFPKFS